MPGTIVLASCLLIFAANAVGAQPTGQLAGVVRDTSGGLLPGATVTVTGRIVAHRTVVTNDRGRYELDNLPADRYQIEVSLSGFEPRTTAIDIEAVAATLDWVLTVGSLSERITVTATKTGAADIQATPIAVTVLPVKTLEQLGAQTIDGLAGFVPTLTISQPLGLAQLTIRGIGTNVVLPGADPSSTIHIDGVYLARPAMALMDFLNVERVEVLRGPQGTLYGRNSVGGTVNIVSRQPTNALETSARITAGSFEKLRAEGAVSGPLIKDKVMGNFAFLRGSHAGFVKDLNHPDHALASEDTWAGRGQLRVVFGIHHELLLSADYARSAGIPLGYGKAIAAKPGFTFDSPVSLWEVRFSDLAVGENVQRGGSAKLTIQLNDTTTLNSLTAYRQSDNRFFVDADGTELQVGANDIRDLQHQVSEEVTLVRRTAKLAWIGGAFLFDERVRGPVLITLYDAGTQSRPDSRQTARAWALFGQSTYQVSDRISLTGGLRYTAEAKDLANTGGLYRLGTSVLAVPASFYDFVDRASYGAWTPKVSIQARATADTFVYASATRGFKSGGFNASWPAPGRPYNPEFAWSLEGGLKQTMAGGRVRANAAVFYTSLQDLQVQALIRPGLLDISNAASANIRGVEIEASAAGRGIHLNASLARLDATYGAYVAVGAGGVTRDAAGNRLNNAPEWSGSGSAVYEFAVARAGTAYMRGDVSRQSRIFFSPFNDAIETQKAYGLVHLRAGVGPRHRRWEIALYARNVTNTEYLTGTSSGSLPAIVGRPGEPRQWGTQFTIRQ
jgi:iron complex outermembrane recepter protein